MADIGGGSHRKSLVAFPVAILRPVAIGLVAIIFIFMIVFADIYNFSLEKQQSTETETIIEVPASYRKPHPFFRQSVRIHDLSSKEEYTQLTSNDQQVMIMYYIPTCVYCKYGLIELSHLLCLIVLLLW